jgi:DNA-binding beta-propeller fold protein YncE
VAKKSAKQSRTLLRSLPLSKRLHPRGAADSLLGKLPGTTPPEALELDHKPKNPGFPGALELDHKPKNTGFPEARQAKRSPVGRSPMPRIIAKSRHLVIATVATLLGASIIQFATATPSEARYQQIATVGLDAAPFDVAVDQGSNRIFLSGSGKVWVVDGYSNTVTTSFTIPKADSYGIGLDHGLGQLYVIGVDSTSPRLSSLYVYDTSTFALKATVGLDNDAYDLAVDEASHKVFVAHTTSAPTRILAIDGQTFSVVDASPMVDTLFFQLSTAGSILFGVGVNNVGSGALYIFNSSDLDSFITRTVSAPFGVASYFDSASALHFAYVSKRSPHEVQKWCQGLVFSSCPGANLVATIPVSGNPHFSSFDTDRYLLYLSHSSPGNVSILKGGPGGSELSVSEVVSVGGSPAGINHNSKTGRVYVANRGSSSLSVLANMQPLSGTFANGQWGAIAVFDAERGSLVKYHCCITDPGGSWSLEVPEASCPSGYKILFIAGNSSQRTLFYNGAQHFSTAPCISSNTSGIDMDVGGAQTIQGYVKDKATAADIDGAVLYFYDTSGAFAGWTRSGRAGPGRYSMPLDPSKSYKVKLVSGQAALEDIWYSTGSGFLEATPVTPPASDINFSLREAGVIYGFVLPVAPYYMSALEPCACRTPYNSITPNGQGFSIKVPTTAASGNTYYVRAIALSGGWQGTARWYATWGTATRWQEASLVESPTNLPNAIYFPP